MRLTTSAVLLGAAASTAVAFQDQKVLGDAHKAVIDVELDSDHASKLDPHSWAKPLEKAFGEFTSEAKATWDELSTLMPAAFDSFKQSLLNDKYKPKPNKRKPDSTWDHVVKGADVQALWVKGEDGESHRQVGGKLENFNLRAKKVDPAKLGVDTVKQYSGYLDDEEQDKHLFYCKQPVGVYMGDVANASSQGSSSRAMIPRMTPSCCGSTVAQDAPR